MKRFIFALLVSINIISFAKDYPTRSWVPYLMNWQEASKECPIVCSDHCGWNNNFLGGDPSFGITGKCGCNC